MNQLQKRGGGPRLAQLFNDPKAHAAATVYRHASGFVDHQQVLVFKNDRKLSRRRGGLITAVGHPNRRHSNFVAQRQAGVGLGAAFVDTHLARANHPINMCFGHPFEQLDEEIVKALALRTLVHGDPPDRWRRRGKGPVRVGRSCRGAGRQLFAPYNVLHHEVAVSD